MIVLGNTQEALWLQQRFEEKASSSVWFVNMVCTCGALFPAQLSVAHSWSKSPIPIPPWQVFPEGNFTPQCVGNLTVDTPGCSSLKAPLDRTCGRPQSCYFVSICYINLPLQTVILDTRPIDRNKTNSNNVANVHVLCSSKLTLKVMLLSCILL